MAEKTGTNLTDEQVRLLQGTARDGDCAYSSEVIRESLREQRARRVLGWMWDEGIASGPCEPILDFEEIKAEGRRRKEHASQ